MSPQVAALEFRSVSATGPEETNTCGVWAVSSKEQGSLFWWLTENRGAFPKADEVTGLRLCFCYGTMTSYLPGGVRLSSPCNCDLSVKTRPLSSWQIEALRSDSLGYTSVATSCEACGLLMWSQCDSLHWRYLCTSFAFRAVILSTFTGKPEIHLCIYSPKNLLYFNHT